jgi:hypothetical protein
VVVHASADTPIPLEQTLTVPARDVPFSRIELKRWARKPRRVSCAAELECARADVDVRRALHDLRPLLPKLPLDPGSVRTAVLEVGLRGRDHKPVFLRLTGKAHVGFPLGDVPFEVEAYLPGYAPPS